MAKSSTTKATSPDHGHGDGARSLGWVSQDFPHGKQQPQQRMDGQARRRFAAHNIHFDYSENRIGPLEDDRVKGYDRMRWEAYGELFAGYWLMSSNQRINAFAGLLGGVAQTHALRTVFDTLEPNARAFGKDG